MLRSLRILESQNHDEIKRADTCLLRRKKYNRVFTKLPTTQSWHISTNFLRVVYNGLRILISFIMLITIPIKCLFEIRHFCVPMPIYYLLHSEEMGKVLFSQVSVCPHFQGGTPFWLMEGGTPSFLIGVPHPSQWEGTSILPNGGIAIFPGGDGGTHPSRQGYPPSQVRMVYPPVGTVQHVLATRRAVCLLR